MQKVTLRDTLHDRQQAVQQALATPTAMPHTENITC